MDNFIPDRRTRIIFQASIIIAGSIAAAGFLTYRTVLIVVGFALAFIITVGFAVWMMRSSIVSIPDSSREPKSTSWAGATIGLAALASLIYFVLGMLGVVPLGERGPYVFFFVWGAVYARLGGFFSKVALIRRERAPRITDRLDLDTKPLFHVIIGIGISVLGILGLLGIYRW